MLYIWIHPARHQRVKFLWALWYHRDSMLLDERVSLRCRKETTGHKERLLKWGISVSEFTSGHQIPPRVQFASMFDQARMGSYPIHHGANPWSPRWRFVRSCCYQLAGGHKDTCCILVFWPCGPSLWSWHGWKWRPWHAWGWSWFSCAFTKCSYEFTKTFIVFTFTVYVIHKFLDTSGGIRLNISWAMQHCVLPCLFVIFRHFIICKCRPMTWWTMRIRSFFNMSMIFRSVPLRNWFLSMLGCIYRLERIRFPEHRRAEERRIRLFQLWFANTCSTWLTRPHIVTGIREVSWSFAIVNYGMLRILAPDRSLMGCIFALLYHLRFVQAGRLVMPYRPSMKPVNCSMSMKHSRWQKAFSRIFHANHPVKLLAWKDLSANANRPIWMSTLAFLLLAQNLTQDYVVCGLYMMVLTTGSSILDNCSLSKLKKHLKVKLFCTCNRGTLTTSDIRTVADHAQSGSILILSHGLMISNMNGVIS